jgi:hypothetical protein
LDLNTFRAVSQLGQKGMTARINQNFSTCGVYMCSSKKTCAAVKSWTCAAVNSWTCAAVQVRLGKVRLG